MRRLMKFEVVSLAGNVIGYVYGFDIDRAWSQAEQRYRVPFALIGGQVRA